MELLDRPTHVLLPNRKRRSFRLSVQVQRVENERRFYDEYTEYIRRAPRRRDDYPAVGRRGQAAIYKFHASRDARGAPSAPVRMCVGAESRERDSRRVFAGLIAGRPARLAARVTTTGVSRRARRVARGKQFAVINNDARYKKARRAVDSCLHSAYREEKTFDAPWTWCLHFVRRNSESSVAPISDRFNGLDLTVR